MDNRPWMKTEKEKTEEMLRGMVGEAQQWSSPPEQRQPMQYPRQPQQVPLPPASFGYGPGQQPPQNWMQPVQQPQIRPLPSGVEPPKAQVKTPATTKKKRVVWFLLGLIAVTTLVFVFTVVKFMMQ